MSFLLTFVAQATFSAHTWQTRPLGLQALMTPHLGVGMTSVLPWAGMAQVTVSCWPAQPHTQGRPGALGQVCSGKGSIPGLSTAHSSQQTTLPPETPPQWAQASPHPRECSETPSLDTPGMGQPLGFLWLHSKHILNFWNFYFEIISNIDKKVAKMGNC